MASFFFSRRFSTLSKLFCKNRQSISYPAAIHKLKSETKPDPNRIHRLSEVFCKSQPSISYSDAIPKLKFEYDPKKILTIFDSISDDPTTVAARRCRVLAVNRLVKSRKFSEIETLLDKQMRNCRVPNEKFFRDTIVCYGKAGMLDRAIQTFDRLHGWLGAPPSALSFNALLSTCMRAEGLDQVPKLFSEILKRVGVSPDNRSYHILVKSLCLSGSIDYAYSVLCEMRKNNVEIMHASYKVILRCCHQNGLVELAEKIKVEIGKKEEEKKEADQKKKKNKIEFCY